VNLNYNWLVSYRTLYGSTPYKYSWRRSFWGTSGPKVDLVEGSAQWSSNASTISVLRAAKRTRHAYRAYKASSGRLFLRTLHSIAIPHLGYVS